MCRYIPSPHLLCKPWIMYDIHTHIHTYKHKYEQTYRLAYTNTCIHKSRHTYIHTYINAYTHTYRLYGRSTLLYKYICIYTYIYTHIDAYPLDGISTAPLQAMVSVRGHNCILLRAAHLKTNSHGLLQCVCMVCMYVTWVGMINARDKRMQHERHTAISSPKGARHCPRIYEMSRMTKKCVPLTVCVLISHFFALRVM